MKESEVRTIFVDVSCKHVYSCGSGYNKMLTRNLRKKSCKTFLAVKINWNFQNFISFISKAESIIFFFWSPYHDFYVTNSFFKINFNIKNSNIICQKDLGGRYTGCRYKMCAKLCVHISKTADLIATKINRPGVPTKAIFFI